MRRAFTILELTIVIIVIGILAAVVIPRLGGDNLEKAALTLQEAIRYAQHLAMVNDKYDPTDQYWYKRKWQVFLSESSGNENAWSIIVFADTGGLATGKPETNEIARNPLDSSKRLTGGYTGTTSIAYEDSRATKEYNIGKKYGIKDVVFSGCGSTARRVAFDELGRPYYGDLSTATAPYKRIMTSQCTITLCLTNCSIAATGEKISVVINPRTGYTYIKRN